MIRNSFLFANMTSFKTICPPNIKGISKKTLFLNHKSNVIKIYHLKTYQIKLEGMLESFEDGLLQLLTSPALQNGVDLVETAVQKADV